MMRITLILIGLIICQLGHTQNQDNKHFVVTAKTGFAGIFEEEQMIDYFSYKPGPAFAFSLGYQQPLNKRGSLIAQLHLQYAYAKTTFINDVSHVINDGNKYTRNMIFQNQYLQAPFYLGLQSKKILFSVGISPSLHLRGKGVIEETFLDTNSNRPIEVTWEKITGESFIAQEPFQDSYSRYIENKIELQALFKISYQTKAWTLGFEFTHFLKDNFFVDETELYDSPGIFKDYTLQSRRSMLLVLSRQL
jgi:hypothetical protein